MYSLIQELQRLHGMRPLQPTQGVLVMEMNVNEYIEHEIRIRTLEYVTKKLIIKFDIVLTVVICSLVVRMLEFLGWV